MAQTQVYIGVNSEVQATTVADPLQHVILTATKKANKEAKREARSLSVLLPIDMLAAGDAPSEYQPLLRAVLLSAAQEKLNEWADSFSSLMPTHVDDHLFTVASLSEAYLTKNQGDWINKDELNVLWNQSATWQRIVNSQNYKENKAYQKAAADLQELVLKMAGKVTMISPAKLDKIVAKLEDVDLETRMGGFILRRAEAMKVKFAAENKELDIDAL